MTSRSVRKLIVYLMLMKSVPLIIAQMCDSNEHYCENTIKCIESEYLCDGDNDCGDNSDEEEALCSIQLAEYHTTYQIMTESSICEDHEIACSEQTGSKCIHRTWVCDGEWDCLHGSDESHCLGKPSTSTNQYTSTSTNQYTSTTPYQRITRPTAILNPFLRVSTHSTETPRRCTNTQFQCPEKCINKGWACDGEKDCKDGSDESPQMCLGRSDSTTQSTSTVRSGRFFFTHSYTTRDDSPTNTDIHSNNAFMPSEEKSSEDCDAPGSSSISFTLLNWIECALLILAIVCIIAIIAFVCKKRKSRSVGLSSRNAEDRRQAVSFLNSSVNSECQLVLVGTPVQVQPTVVQSTIDPPPSYDTQPLPNPSRMQNSTKGEEYLM